MVPKEICFGLRAEAMGRHIYTRRFVCSVTFFEASCLVYMSYSTCDVHAIGRAIVLGVYWSQPCASYQSVHQSVHV
jgi:hypothetical protein